MKKFSAGIGICLSLGVAVLLAGNVTALNLQVLEDLWHNPRFVQALLFSLTTSGGATLCAFFFGVPAALWLRRSHHWSARFCGIILELPLVIPPLIIGVLLLKLSSQTLVQEFIRLVFTFKGALVVQFLVALPLMIKSAESAFRLIPTQYEHLAMTMGATPRQAFFDTTWRLAWPGILAGIALTWMRALGEFGATLMVGGGIPGKTENIPIFIYLSISEGNFAAGMGACALLVLTVLLVLFLLRSWGARKRLHLDQMDI
ncbi:MAG: ABC transporter permease subunit [Desulfuromonadaceae bacterium]